MIAALDIGSTWTKGALFGRAGEVWELLARHTAPTTVDDLATGVLEVLGRLCPEHDWVDFADGAPPVPVRLSSSAKGGLGMAVVGLVPDMSLHIARLAACSAGARVGRAFSYKLTSADIAAIERDAPDIVLLTGGTDGGDESYVLANARKLAGAKLECAVIFAGNRAAASEVGDILKGHSHVICENVMPDYGRLNTEPAHAAIREIFLERIIEGKGVAGIARRLGCEPRPTPRAVLELVEAIGRNLPEWGEFLVCDLGGATTDVYSFCESYHSDAGTLVKGVVEPRLKRSVEGDLGMRVGAMAACEVLKPFFVRRAGEGAPEPQALRAYCERIARDTSYLPDCEETRGFDRLLAEGCLLEAVERHAGCIEEVFTPEGRVHLQTGKDLRRVKRVIGTGGYLAASTPGCAAPVPSFRAAGSGARAGLSLVPEAFRWYFDQDYIFPMLGSLVEDDPRAAAMTAVGHLGVL